VRGEQQTSDAEDTMLPAERSELLEKSLAELPEEYREILVLRKFEQVSYREISSIANIQQLGTIMPRLSRARRRLPANYPRQQVRRGNSDRRSNAWWHGSSRYRCLTDFGATPVIAAAQVRKNTMAPPGPGIKKETKD
jgi:hypothetical protein